MPLRKLTKISPAGIAALSVLVAGAPGRGAFLDTGQRTLADTLTTSKLLEGSGVDRSVLSTLFGHGLIDASIGMVDVRLTPKGLLKYRQSRNVMRHLRPLVRAEMPLLPSRHCSIGQTLP